VSDWLIDEILRYTHSRHSISFYKQAIALLGEGIVAEELGELKYQIQMSEVKNPASYFTTMLKERMKIKAILKPETRKNLHSYKSPNQIQLFAELKLTNEIESDENKTSLDIAFKEDVIKFPTLLSNTFFTLSTNKSKSDEVPIKLSTHEGIINGTLVRGRIKRGTKETGILTTFDGRIFLAVIHIWQEKGCKISLEESETGNHFCGIVRFNINELVRKIYSKIKRPSGKESLNFINSLQNLCDYSYCMYFPNGNTELYHGFRLLGMPSIAGIKRGRQTEKTGVTIMLSPEITRQYFNKRYLNRPEQLTKVKSELTFLLWLYLESRVESLDGVEYSAELRHLIKELRLPKADWHDKPSTRLRQFQKCIKELQGQKTGSGRSLEVRIDKGLFDWLFMARVIENKGTTEKYLTK